MQRANIKPLFRPVAAANITGVRFPYSRSFHDVYFVHDPSKRAGSPERLCARSKPEKPCLACVGFTLNVNRKPGIDYAAVAASAPDVRVVAYLRTNRVKAAVSRVRGKLLDAVCGYNNIRVGDNKRRV